MSQDPDLDRWARLRFAIIGPLLAAPPAQGELRTALEGLARRHWKHPVNGTMLQFSTATLERWYYAARKARDPVAVLRRQGRNDAGRPRRLSVALMQALQIQYQAYPGWSVQLHYDNLAAEAETDESLGPVPGYGTVRRYMKARGLHRKRRPKRKTSGAQQAEERLRSREVRSYEVDHVHGLWHLDYHHGSRKVLTSGGRWVTPLLLCVVDDHSRLICHLQWYLEETTETLVHGVCQALQKRGLPRAVMTDNGSAMTADEFRSGLHTLGILHETTLPYRYQNAKQETLWATVEGRLMAMLEGVRDLDLEQLNTFTQAWAERDYHQNRHAEIGVTPMRRMWAGKRFEIPDRYRHMEQFRVRYARWDLRSVELVDPHTQATLCPLYPLDKSANAQGLRRTRAPEQAVPAPQQDELPALLRKLLADYAATGRPPAYLPKPPKDPEDTS